MGDCPSLASLTLRLHGNRLAGRLPNWSTVCNLPAVLDVTV
eukprot:NODE_3864_length_396_cov_71.317003_g3425_i0.p2 GENE.NODE_3864_length_396_cov_71.317003_g3425_i0~~NODE_3864_length_396_cov_71.317003_g3425_i0.p2  ORF type:complete len:51 (-),score=15.39 NODE_3864_length_396_cov_71.317003_g3425_i0:243-365(-)